MKYSGDYYVTVIEDTRINQLIGSATLVIEHKFIHECGEVMSFILDVFGHTINRNIYFHVPHFHSSELDWKMLL